MQGHGQTDEEDCFDRLLVADMSGVGNDPWYQGFNQIVEVGSPIANSLLESNLSEFKSRDAKKGKRSRKLNRNNKRTSATRRENTRAAVDLEIQSEVLAADENGLICGRLILTFGSTWNTEEASSDPGISSIEGHNEMKEFSDINGHALGKMTKKIKREGEGIANVNAFSQEYGRGNQLKKLGESADKMGNKMEKPDITLKDIRGEKGLANKLSIHAVNRLFQLEPMDINIF